MESNISAIEVVDGKLYFDGQCVEIVNYKNAQSVNNTLNTEININEIAESSITNEQTSVEQFNNSTCDEISSLSSQATVIIEASDNDKLINILNRFRLLEILPHLQAHKITYRSLKYLSKEDLVNAIPDVGPRAIFREKLFTWRKLEYGIDDETMSINSKITQWMKGNEPSKTSETFTKPTIPTNPFTKFEISKILNESGVGRSMIKYYESTKQLTNSHRNDLIRLIVEDINVNHTDLKPSDFPHIVDQIIQVFPSEKEITEYYYIPRQGKKNPSGKLYGKYANSKCKKKKLDILPCTSQQNLDCSISQKDAEETDEFDESILMALKTALQREVTNWEEVKDKWQKTFSVRQRDLKNMTIGDFLKSWPKYVHSKAPDLIEIDFDLLYPGKTLFLFAKWEIFKKKIRPYYEANINNLACQELFKCSKNVTNCDTEDYILTTLLNSILHPTARFKDKAGNNKRKATIADGQEAFILQLDCINDYRRKIEDLTTKYYYSGLTIQPLVVIEGSINSGLTNFYVYFDGSLYKFPSFISSLDTCFKIFQIFNLKYPQACEIPWNFIQHFFYNISTTFDVKSPSLVGLMNHMTS